MRYCLGCYAGIGFSWDDVGLVNLQAIYTLTALGLVGMVDSLHVRRLALCQVGIGLFWADAVLVNAMAGVRVK